MDPSPSNSHPRTPPSLPDTKEGASPLPTQHTSPLPNTSETTHEVSVQGNAHLDYPTKHNEERGQQTEHMDCKGGARSDAIVRTNVDRMCATSEALLLPLDPWGSETHQKHAYMRTTEEDEELTSKGSSMGVENDRLIRANVRETSQKAKIDRAESTPFLPSIEEESNQPAPAGESNADFKHTATQLIIPVSSSSIAATDAPETTAQAKPTEEALLSNQSLATKPTEQGESRTKASPPVPDGQPSEHCESAYMQLMSPQPRHPPQKTAESSAILEPESRTSFPESGEDPDPKPELGSDTQVILETEDLERPTLQNSQQCSASDADAKNKKPPSDEKSKPSQESVPIPLEVVPQTPQIHASMTEDTLFAARRSPCPPYDLLSPLPIALDHLLLLDNALPAPLLSPLTSLVHPDLTESTFERTEPTFQVFPGQSSLGLTLFANETFDTPATEDTTSLAPAASLHLPNASPSVTSGSNTIEDVSEPTKLSGLHPSPPSTARALPQPPLDNTLDSEPNVEPVADSANNETLARDDALSHDVFPEPTGPAASDLPLPGPNLEVLLSTPSDTQASVALAETQDLPPRAGPSSDVEAHENTDGACAEGEAGTTDDSPTPEDGADLPVPGLESRSFPSYNSTDTVTIGAASEGPSGPTGSERSGLDEVPKSEDPPSPGLPPSSAPSSQLSDLSLQPTDDARMDDPPETNGSSSLPDDNVSDDEEIDQLSPASPLPSSQPQCSTPDRVFSSPPPYNLSSPPTSPHLAPSKESGVIEDLAIMKDVRTESRDSVSTKKRSASNELQEDTENKRAKTTESYTPPPPPNPRRPTLLGQKKQHRKLVQPFRSPIVKLEDILAGKDGVYASGRSPAEKTAKREPLEDPNSVDASGSTAPESTSVKTAATKDRTARAGKPFKSLVPQSTQTDVLKTSSGATSGVKTGSTVQALQARVQKLKQALRIKSEHDAEGEQRLEVMVARWRSVGREVAWLVWDTIKDLDPGDALKPISAKGGWGDDEVGSVGKSKGRRPDGNGFQAGWGWNDGKEAGGKRSGFDNNWGWDDRKEGEEGADERHDETDEGMEVDEEIPVQRHSLGTMMRYMGIDPETLGWDEEEGDFVGEP